LKPGFNYSLVLQDLVIFRTEGAAILSKHDKNVDHDSSSLRLFQIDQDKKFSRRTDSIGARNCVKLLAGMYQAAIFDTFNCTTCPVGIANRAREIYVGQEPNATYYDFGCALVCVWICRRMSQHVANMKRQLAFLPYLAYPEMVNKKPEMVTKSSFIYGKLMINCNTSRNVRQVKRNPFYFFPS
jgi:hypothetical protein